jgi:endonuclease YncB( thermonuclease family)
MPSAKKIPPPVVGAIRKRRRNIWLIRLLIVSLVLWSIADHALSHGDDWSDFDHHQFTVAAATDVQTITVAFPGGRPVPIHLLGVAGCTPRWDDLATAHLQYYVGQTVVLQLEPTQTHDPQGRLLAWAFLENNETLNARLVRFGFALADRPHPSSMLTSVEAAEREARSKHRGLWSEVDWSQMPAWRQSWTIQQHQAREKLQRLLVGD